MVVSTQGKCRCENQISQIKPTQLVKNNLIILAKGKYFALFQYLGNRELYARIDGSKKKLSGSWSSYLNSMNQRNKLGQPNQNQIKPQN